MMLEHGLFRGSQRENDSPRSIEERDEGRDNFSTPNISLNCFDEVVADSMYGPNDGDFFAIPDPNTFAILPYR